MIRKKITHTAVYLLAYLMTTFYSPSGIAVVRTTALAEAESTTTSQPQTTDSSTAKPGPTAPNGDASHTFTFNAASGLWENEYYTWDPATNSTVSKTPKQYTYDATSNSWESSTHEYDAAKDAYVEVSKPVSSKDVPLNSSTPATSTSQTPQNDTSMFNQPSTSGGTSTAQDKARVTNTIGSNATTGNTLISSNSSGGSASSGDAEAVANVLNLLQSTFNPQSGDIMEFTATIDGNIHGDLYFDPLVVGRGRDAEYKTTANLKVNASNDTAIANKINLDATSGDASVANNTSAGSARSGDATTIANVMNLVNSSVSSGKSIIGTINVTGDLEGDILLPKDYVDKVLATNAHSKTTIKADLQAINSASHGIVNTVNANTNTGKASVLNNTSAGNASSGDALTDVTVLNMTESSVVGKNALLVFVNVLGEWVGLIMDAPAGATAATLGGGTTYEQRISAAANIETNTMIANDIHLNSESGNARVEGNTTAGNAESGDAVATANIFNSTSSSFDLSDWFGILFINIGGNWHGSFGVDTAFGDPVAEGDVVATEVLPQNTFMQIKDSRKVNTQGHSVANVASWQPTNTHKTIADRESSDGGAVLADFENNVSGGSAENVASAAPKNDSLNRYIPNGPVMGIAASLLTIDRILHYKKKGTWAWGNRKK